MFLFLFGMGAALFIFIQKRVLNASTDMKKEAERFVPTTQDNLPIDKIRGGIVKLKKGGYRILVEIPSINIDLMEPSEKEVVLYQYAGVLNSFDFPFQYLQQSRVVDISEYLENIQKYKSQTKNPFMQKQLQFYSEFVVSLIRQSMILTKRFYMVIPFDEERERKLRGQQPIKKADGKEKTIADEEVEYEKARKQLFQRAKLVDNAFRRFGVNPRVLSDTELLDLFQTAYNKNRSVYQSLRGKDPSSYTSLYVKTGKGGGNRGI
jgi:hypothetical protein